MKYQLKDIPIKEVLVSQYHWTNINNDIQSGKLPYDFPNYFTYQILGKKYGSEKLVLKKMEQLAKDGYLEYGVSLRTSWLTDKAKELLKQ